VDYATLKARVGGNHHDLAAEIDALVLSPGEKLRLLLDAFDDQQVYGVLMYVKHLYDEAPSEIGRDLFQAYGAYLASSDTTKAEQVLYSLWCDFFEDPRTVQAAWTALAQVGQPALTLQRLLPTAGPVPWALKSALLHDLLPNDDWHPFIFRCLLHSSFDVYGQIDKEEARRILRQLHLPPDTLHLGELKKAVGT